MELQYVYLIQLREFVRLKEPVYKIGRTKQHNFLRVKQYPKDSNVLYQLSCDDCIICENQIIQLFKTKYIQRSDIGTEYFEGDYKSMRDDIFEIIKETSLITPNQLSIENIEGGFKSMEVDIFENINETSLITIEKNKKIKFYCEKCIYGCDNKKDFNKHLSSNKHKEEKPSLCFDCTLCHKSYAYKSGLSKHKKICKMSLIL